MEEELKDSANKFIQWAIHTPYIIVIAILISLSIFFYHQNDVKSKEILVLKTGITLQQDLEKEQAKLDDMKKREAELYPKLQKDLKDKEDLTLQLEALRKQIKYTPKKEIEDAVSKMDSKALSDYFSKLGFNNTISSK